MASTSQMKMLVVTLVVAFTISGCQTSGRWGMAWKDPAKPKTEFKDPNETEQVSYWPYKTVKNKAKMTPVPSQLQEKVAQRTAKANEDSQLKELIKDGDLLRGNNQLEDARLVYRKALAISPDNADIHRKLAIVADLQGNFSVADEHYAAALRSRPRDVDIMSDMGYSHMLRKNPQKAEMVLREALLFDPTHKLAMANLARIYAEQNRYNEALAMFRAGGTEAEAQQNIATFFPQGVSLAVVSGTQDPAQSKVSLAVGSTVTENQLDLKNATFEQIQAEMARRKQVAQRQRQEADQRELAKYRNLEAAEEAEGMQGSSSRQAAMQQGSPRANGPAAPITIGPPVGDNRASNDPRFADTFQRQGVALQPGLSGPMQDPAPQGNMPPTNQRFQAQDHSLAAAPGSNRQTEIFRGSASSSQPARQVDPSSQRGWNSQGPGSVANNMLPPGPNNYRPTNELTSSQMVTQIGMTVGPGSLFPAPPSTGGVGLPPNAFDSRFGAEYSQSPGSQNSQNWAGDPNEQRRGATANSTDEGLIIAPPSPSSNWGPPSMTSGPNWQNAPPDSSGWPNELQSGNARSNGSDRSGFLSGWGQNDARRPSEGVEIAPQGLSSPNRYRNVNDAPRPYNGAWPNSNSLPPRQNQGGSDDGSRFDLSDQFGGGPMNAGGTTNPGNQNGSTGNSAGNSLPQWPYAPNR